MLYLQIVMVNMFFFRMEMNAVGERYAVVIVAKCKRWFSCHKNQEDQCNGLVMCVMGELPNVLRRSGATVVLVEFNMFKQCCICDILWTF